MLQPLRLQRLHLEITLGGEHFRHAIGNRGAGGKNNAASAIPLLDMADLEQHVESALGSGLRQARDPRHLGDIKEILESLAFIDEDPVHAKLLEGEGVVFLMVRRE